MSEVPLFHKTTVTKTTLRTRPSRSIIILIGKDRISPFPQVDVLRIFEVTSEALRWYTYKNLVTVFRSAGTFGSRTSYRDIQVTGASRS